MWNSTEANAAPVMVQNPGYTLEHAARDMCVVNPVELLAEVIEKLGRVSENLGARREG